MAAWEGPGSPNPHPSAPFPVTVMGVEWQGVALDSEVIVSSPPGLNIHAEERSELREGISVLPE